MKIVPTVKWKNCRGLITRVTLEVREIMSNGGIDGSITEEYFPNLVHKRNSTEIKSFSRFLVDATNNNPDSVGFETDEDGDALMTCSQRADGRVPPDIAGVTFYTMAIAYNASNKVIFRKVSPVVACGE